METDLLTLPEACAALSLSRPAILYHIAKGRIAAEKIPVPEETLGPCRWRWAISRAAVESFDAIMPRKSRNRNVRKTELKEEAVNETA